MTVADNLITDKITNAAGQISKREFNGWVAPEGITVTGSKFIMPENDVDLTGPWTFIPHASFTVSYVVTGDTPAAFIPEIPGDTLVQEGATIKLAPFLTSYSLGPNGEIGTWTFNGWAVPEGVAINVYGEFIMPGKDVIFIGYWIFTPSTITQPEIPILPPQPEPLPPLYNPYIPWQPWQSHFDFMYAEDIETVLMEYDEYDFLILTPVDPLPVSATHYAFMIGFAEDGTIRPLANVTRAEAATIFFRLTTDEHRAKIWSQENSFTDVPLEMWFNNPISTMELGGLFTGMPLGSNFFPNQPATRAEFAAMVVNYLGLGHYRVAINSAFTDIDGHWASDAINVAYLQGWVNGFIDGTFRPDDFITRAQVAALVNRALGRLPEYPGDLLDGMIRWPDNMDEDAFYYLYIQEATNSHRHETKADGVHETWTELIPERDWRSLERPDSNPFGIMT